MKQGCNFDKFLSFHLSNSCKIVQVCAYQRFFFLRKKKNYSYLYKKNSINLYVFFIKKLLKEKIKFIFIKMGELFCFFKSFGGKFGLKVKGNIN